MDVTLAAGGRHLQAHKVVLSACSEYFQSVFAANPCQVRIDWFCSTIQMLYTYNFCCFSTLL